MITGTMCGRLVVTEPDLSVLVQPFGVEIVDAGEWHPRFNLPPTELAPLITNEPERRLTLAAFGLQPSWARDQRPGGKFINARIESIAKSKVFSRALALRRGVIPVTGYYEWRKLNSKRLPQFIHRAHGEPLALAGVWDRWRSADGQLVQSFAVITRPAIGFMQALHSRMPLSLRAEDVEAWLAPGERSAAELEQVLASEPQLDDLVQRPVTPLVNSVQNDSPECLTEMTEAEGATAPARGGSAQLDLFEAIDSAPSRTRRMR